MEFNYRAADDPPPQYISPPPPVNYYSNSPLQGGYTYNVDRMQSPIYMREPFNVREMEKQRIREEIIAEEFMRRRALEAEVRMELMMEREMAMRNFGDFRFPPYGERFPMPVEPWAPTPIMHRFRDRWIEEEPPRWENRRPRGELLALPAPRPPSPEIRAPPPERKTEKVIMLSRPDQEPAGKKRKSPPESGVRSLPSTSWKKPKEEWSCAICRVSATSEKGLQEHIKGKKHLAKEEELRTQKMVKDSYNKPWPKKVGEPSKVAKAPATPTAVSDQKAKLKNKVHKLPQKILQGAAKMVKDKKNFKFWCEECSVGGFSPIVFDDHLKGKVHKARLEELAANGKVPPSLQILDH